MFKLVLYFTFPLDYHFNGSATVRTSRILIKSDAPTYIAIVKHQSCNHCFYMFHNGCCMKHSFHVAAGIFYPRVERHSYF